MKKLIIILLGILSVSLNSFGEDEYPDAKRDRDIIEKAFKMQGISDLKNLKFPLGKQVFTGSMTALIKIPELIGYFSGQNKEGFYTFHVITFEAKGEKHTCVASVQITTDNSEYVEIANCGKNSWKFMNNERLVSRKMVVSPMTKNGGSNQKPVKNVN